jgi:hypothetical protein
MTRTSCEEGATMLSSRMSNVSPTIGMVVTITWVMKFQGSHLSLKKISQTKNE